MILGGVVFLGYFFRVASRLSARICWILFSVWLVMFSGGKRYRVLPSGLRRAPRFVACWKTL